MEKVAAAPYSQGQPAACASNRDAHTHTYRAPMLINTLPDRQLNLGRNHCIYTSTNGLLLLLSLADPDKGLLV